MLKRQVRVRFAAFYVSRGLRILQPALTVSSPIVLTVGLQELARVRRRAFFCLCAQSCEQLGNRRQKRFVSEWLGDNGIEKARIRPPDIALGARY